MSYDNVFGGSYDTIGTDTSLYPPIQADMSLGNTGQNTIGGLLSNPAIQTAMFNFAKALDPKGFGGRLAEGALQMRQANSLATGLGQATEKPVTPVAPPVANAGTQPAGTQVAGTNVAGQAPGSDTYTKMGKLLKDAFNLDPSEVKDSFKNQVISNLLANPNGNALENPTQAVGSMSGQVPAAVEPVQSMSLNPQLAMSMTPEQVQSIFAHKLNVQRQADLTRAQNNADAMLPTEIAYKQAATEHTKWMMDPKRVEETIRINTAPVLAQLEVFKGKQQFDMQTANEFIAANPGLAKTKLPGSNMRVGDFIKMSALSGRPGAEVAAMTNMFLDYRAAMARISAEVSMSRERLAADKSQNDFYKLYSLAEKTQKDLAQYSSDIAPEAWAKLTPEQQQMNTVMGIKQRTPERQAALTALKGQYAYLWGKIGNMAPENAGALKGTTEGIAAELAKLPPGYNGRTDKNAPGSNYPAFDITVTKDDPRLKALEQRMYPTSGGDTGKKKATVAPSNFLWDMFKPGVGYGYGGNL